ncbi:TniQ family protein [Actinoplanes rectilineatus]|uniref:TniQ family protein n=1 Tax=Actinoplanes rectilineatus TaxID=113571 RepID=UPI0005F27F3B|nr:TniQ family protein [Actinoplanes rectilineatus]
MTISAERLLPLRRLPRTPPPLVNETVHSYLWRLAEANALTGQDLHLHLTGSKKRRKDDIAAEQLSALTGFPERTLRYAMLELCSPDDLATMHVAGRPRPGPTGWGLRWPHHRIRYACDHCAAQRGVITRRTARATVWTTHEEIVCLRHRRWLGVRHQGNQLDLTCLPDILKANRRHRRMIKLFGRERVRNATMDAVPICHDWNTSLWEGKPAYQRIQVFKHLDYETRFVDNATLDAATYPEAMALARLFASPYWRHQAVVDNLEPVDKRAMVRLFEEAQGRQTDPDLLSRLHAAAAGVLQEGPALARFVGEIQRTVNLDYRWNAWPHYRKFGPITQWIMDEIDAIRNPGGHRSLRRYESPEHYEQAVNIPRQTQDHRPSASRLASGLLAETQARSCQ